MVIDNLKIYRLHDNFNVTFDISYNYNDVREREREREREILSNF